MLEDKLLLLLKELFGRFYDKMENSSSSFSLFERNRALLRSGRVIEKDLVTPTDQSPQGEVRKLEPEWLDKFFKKTFFIPCSRHPIRGNVFNKYCIDCDLCLCQYCLVLSSHKNHRVLKIYRHVYKDVVPLDEIEQHVDCSQIQPYRCNKQLVIALTPLPHSGSRTSDDEETCLVCNRKLIEYDVFNYCSIACKVEAFMKKVDETSPPFLSFDHLVQNGNIEYEMQMATADQPVQNVNQEPKRKKPTVDLPAERAETALKKTTADQQRVKVKQETETSTTAFDRLVHTANRPPAVVNFRTRKRKGTPRRSPLY